MIKIVLFYLFYIGEVLGISVVGNGEILKDFKLGDKL